MKTYEVKLFILGLPYSEHNVRYVYIDADTQDEAEQIAHDKYVSDRWGVYSSKEVREGLTDTQKEETIKRMDYLLGLIITDAIDRSSVIESLQEDVFSDIEQCADWQSLDEDEWCEGDVDIAVARILKERIVG